MENTQQQTRPDLLQVQRANGRSARTAISIAARQRLSDRQAVPGHTLKLFTPDTILVLKGAAGMIFDARGSGLAATMEEPHYCIRLESQTDDGRYDVVLTDHKSFEECRPGRSVAMSVMIPKSALLQTDRVAPVLPVRLTARAGFSQLLSNILLPLPGLVVRQDTPHHPALADAVISVIKTAFFDAMPVQKAKCRVSTLDRIKAHIDYTLDDPDLNPGDVAQHMGISRRYLHQLFAETSETFVAYLQRQRVDRIAQDLCDPANNETITECAFRWGFNDPSHFSRVFRRLKGRTATDFINAQRSGCSNM